MKIYKLLIILTLVFLPLSIIGALNFHSPTPEVVIIEPIKPLPDIKYKPYEDIKALEGRYNCDVLNQGFMIGQKGTQEELLFWLNYCLDTVIPNQLYDEPVEFSDLTQIDIGIAHCNMLKQKFMRGDKMFKDEVGDYFLWCI